MEIGKDGNSVRAKILAVCVCAHRLVLTRHIGRTAGQKTVMEDVLRTVAVPTEQFA